MNTYFLRPTVLSVAIAAGLLSLSGTVSAGSFTGPSSSQTPYVTPTANGWDVTSLISVGDSAKDVPYRFVGIPDGLGAVAGRFNPHSGKYTAKNSYLTVFANHELGASAGVTRVHGQKGAFVSQWTLHLDSLKVLSGEDLIRQVLTWNPVGGQFVDSTGATAFGRFCSADLPPKTAFYNPKSGKGYKDLLFTNGEESGNEGRGFAHIVSGRQKGTSYELPYLGKFSWENAVAHPNAGDKTIVVGLDDTTPGQVYVYVGDKQDSGNPVEKAGLQGGKLFGIKIPSKPFETGQLNSTFSLEDVSDLATGTGAALQTQSQARGITEFARPEDGHWDTQNARVFYFVTTGANRPELGGTQTSRLYKLTFDSLKNPTGGAIELVVDSKDLTGTDGEPARSFDNITVDAKGKVLVQEDPGNNAYIAKTWEIDPVTKSAVQILESDRDRFQPGAANFLTQDEENSGIIEVTDLVKSAKWFEKGRRYFLADTQAHYSINSTNPRGFENPDELVEGGQLYLISSPSQKKQK